MTLPILNGAGDIYNAWDDCHQGVKRGPDWNEFRLDNLSINGSIKRRDKWWKGLMETDGCSTSAKQLLAKSLDVRTNLSRLIVEYGTARTTELKFVSKRRKSVLEASQISLRVGSTRMALNSLGESTYNCSLARFNSFELLATSLRHGSVSLNWDVTNKFSEEDLSEDSNFYSPEDASLTI